MFTKIQINFNLHLNPKRNKTKTKSQVLGMEMGSKVRGMPWSWTGRLTKGPERGLAMVPSRQRLRPSPSQGQSPRVFLYTRYKL